MSVEGFFNFDKITGGDGLRWEKGDIVIGFGCRVADEKSDFGSFFLCLGLILRMRIKIHREFLKGQFEEFIRW